MRSKMVKHRSDAHYQYIYSSNHYVSDCADISVTNNMPSYELSTCYEYDLKVTHAKTSDN